MPNNSGLWIVGRKGKAVINLTFIAANGVNKNYIFIWSMIKRQREQIYLVVLAKSLFILAFLGLVLAQ